MICVLDTETTGLPNANWTRVMELGAVAMEPSGMEVAVFHSLIKPDVFDERADRALTYTGLTRENFLLAPYSDVVREEFSDWCSEHRIQQVWAYNRIFDETMLARSGFYLPWTGCIMRKAREQMPVRPKDPPLREAALYFLGYEPDVRHRALEDATVAAQVLSVLLRST